MLSGPLAASPKLRNAAFVRCTKIPQADLSTATPDYHTDQELVVPPGTMALALVDPAPQWINGVGVPLALPARIDVHLITSVTGSARAKGGKKLMDNVAAAQQMASVNVQLLGQMLGGPVLAT